ncbi:uncharacterized protein [Centruroides vittatus]|uniref:uncharacterized protein n=1 Tax=Centruroides vittatus TaxID=120091 RepID=UPI00350FC1C9
MGSHYLTSYQQDYYWQECERETPRNEYERRLVWSKCPWRYYPKVGQTEFTRQYQPWGILPRWPHLFSIEEAHEHPRDRKHTGGHLISKSLDNLGKDDDYIPARYEEYPRRVPHHLTLPPIEKDAFKSLPSSEICQSSFRAPIWCRGELEKIPKKNEDKTVRIHQPRYPFEYPTWKSVHMYDYKWDLQAD